MVSSGEPVKPVKPDKPSQEDACADECVYEEVVDDVVEAVEANEAADNTDRISQADPDEVMVVDLTDVEPTVEPVEAPREVAKYGLLIGINYTGTNNALNGCINDILNLKHRLVTDKYFSEDDLVLMCDHYIGGLYPTGANILMQMEKLVQFANNNKDKDVHLFLSYSGHGYYVPDLDGDEGKGVNGKDQVICPVDCDTKGVISDDQLNRLLISRLPSNATLVVLMDCCHSGSILDLKYRYNIDTNKTDITSKMTASQCRVVMISGCRDDQTSADATIRDEVDDRMEAQGAMTAAWLSNYKERISYKELVVNMRKWLKDRRYTQVPQLSSGIMIDVDGRYMLESFN